MKILDIPQSGKRGLTVSQGGRYGQISRALVIPTNPRTAAQLAIRQIMSAVAARWRALTEVQRAAWSAAAKLVESKPRLGQSGPLTGNQLFNKINVNLSLFGEQQVDVPPSAPVFAALAVQALAITNTANVIAIKLTCPSSPGDNTIIRGAAPQSAGRGTCNDFRVLGKCPAPVTGASDITGIYTARFGVPAVGSKVFVRANQLVDGWEDVPHEFVAIVPASS
jgi:hypothetical protein